jgi:hypothetical protein
MQAQWVALHVGQTPVLVALTHSPHHHHLHQIHSIQHQARQHPAQGGAGAQVEGAPWQSKGEGVAGQRQSILAPRLLQHPVAMLEMMALMMLMLYWGQSTCLGLLYNN